jgi:hypothetical protein
MTGRAGLLTGALTRRFDMPNFRELLDQRLEIRRQLILGDQHRFAAARHGDLILERVGFRSRGGASGGEQSGDRLLYPCCGLSTKLGGVDFTAKRDPREAAASSDLDSHSWS